MKLQDFYKFAENQVSSTMDGLNPGSLNQNTLPDLDSEATQQTNNLLTPPTPTMPQFDIKTAQISKIGEKIMQKIADELTELTIKTGVKVVDDPDYRYLLKEAGIKPPTEPDINLHYLLSGSFDKIANIAQTPANKELLSKVWKEMPGVARWGTLGRYAALGVPLVGGAAYLKGRSTGKEKGKQELTDALMQRYHGNQ